MTVRLRFWLAMMDVVAIVPGGSGSAAWFWALRHAARHVVYEDAGTAANNEEW